MDLAQRTAEVAVRRRQRQPGEGEARGQGLTLALRQRGQAREAVEAADQRHRDQPYRVAAEEAGLLVHRGLPVEKRSWMRRLQTSKAGSPGRSAGRWRLASSVTAAAATAFVPHITWQASSVCAARLPARSRALAAKATPWASCEV